VVSQTRCKIDVFPAFALPITSTRNWIAGIRGWLCGGVKGGVAQLCGGVARLRACLIRLCAVPIGAVRCEEKQECCGPIDFDSNDRWLRRPRVHSHTAPFRPSSSILHLPR
jgi:hypothetical protein